MSDGQKPHTDQKIVYRYVKRNSQWNEMSPNRIKNVICSFQVKCTYKTLWSCIPVHSTQYKIEHKKKSYLWQSYTLLDFHRIHPNSHFHHHKQTKLVCIYRHHIWIVVHYMERDPVLAIYLKNKNKKENNEKKKWTFRVSIEILWFNFD